AIEPRVVEEPLRDEIVKAVGAVRGPRPVDLDDEPALARLERDAKGVRRRTGDELLRRKRLLIGAAGERDGGDRERGENAFHPAKLRPSAAGSNQMWHR